MNSKPDIEITGSDEAVSRITGLTDDGIEFIDSYMAAEVGVVDSGIITLLNDAVDAFVAACTVDDFTVLREAD